MSTNATLSKMYRIRRNIDKWFARKLGYKECAIVHGPYKIIHFALYPLAYIHWLWDRSYPYRDFDSRSIVIDRETQIPYELVEELRNNPRCRRIQK